MDIAIEHMLVLHHYGRHPHCYNLSVKRIREIAKKSHILIEQIACNSSKDALGKDCTDRHCCNRDSYQCRRCEKRSTQYEDCDAN